MQMEIFYDADVSCKDENAKFISARIQTMMQMFPCGDGDAKLLRCKCPLVGMPWCKCFDANTTYSKTSFVFKSRLPRPWNQNIFKTRFIILEKSYFFLLKAQKKKLVIIVRNLWMAIDLESDDLAQKIYFHNLVEQKGGTFPRPFLEKNEFFENQAS